MKRVNSKGDAGQEISVALLNELVSVKYSVPAEVWYHIHVLNSISRTLDNKCSVLFVCVNNAFI